MSKTAKKKPYPQALALGLLSLASYYFLFTNVNQVMEYFVRGGVYTVLPIVTALYFSIVYGSFASTVLSIVGLQAAKGTGH
ncbi:MAG: hypothetical protein HZB44_00740 [Actinobacteria bacterium]|nr:hypothetical protein [Actinomycetota bacterium]